MNPLKIHLVAGARPNFMKVAPLYHGLKNESWCQVKIVHTGQHYDAEMSDNFFLDLKLPSPHIRLNAGSGSHAEQTAAVLVKYEKALLEDRPDLVVVVGDVNSTFAACLAAKKLGLTVAHLEAGLRSFDRSMPEELNRVLTDSICDYHWTPSAEAGENLKKEGVDSSKIFFVGNIMIDSYLLLKEEIARRDCVKRFNLENSPYGLITIHRPSNVDDDTALRKCVEAIKRVSENFQLVFPVHPRTKQRLENTGLWASLEKSGRIQLVNPLGYLDFMSLVEKATFVITDSGGVQEETTYLGIPCITLRESTERPVTVSEGSNRLVNTDTLFPVLMEILGKKAVSRTVPLCWDGKTAIRIVSALRKLFTS